MTNPKQFSIRIAVTLLLVASFGYLRLLLFPDRFVPLTYGLALLVCLWHRDLRLLYGMAVAFSAMACFKLFGFMAYSEVLEPWYEWTATGMVLVNIWTVTAVIHALIALMNRLELKNQELQAANVALENSNQELMARDEEISRQNEELQAQAEELEQQTEELRQQTEEMDVQKSELQELNGQLERREVGFQTLLNSVRWLHEALSEEELLTAISQAAVQVIGNEVCAAVVREKNGHVAIPGHWGFALDTAAASRAVFAHSFGALAIEAKKTAALPDVMARPDIQLPQPAVGAPFRSVLASPIWINGQIIGAVEIYAREPRDWTEEEFRLVQWMAAQTAMAIRGMQHQREIEQARQIAEEASEYKTRFLAAVSHDIRTPANAISLLAELIQRAAADSSRAEDVSKMTRDLKISARSFVEFVSDVLDLERLDAGSFDLQISNFSLPLLIKEELHQFQPLAEAKGLRLTTNGSPAEVELRTDRLKLARVLANLVGNAIKFTEAGDVRVNYSLTQSGGAELAVTDTGIGIAAADLQAIFEEFRQLSNPHHDRANGAGLGLAICKRLVEGLSCQLDVQSEPGSGTTFTIRIPRELLVQTDDRTRSGDDGESRTAAGPGEVDASALEGLRILLVEDHELTCAATARLLAECGAVVLQAHTAHAARAIMNNERPNVLLLDLMLPDEDGMVILSDFGRHRPPHLRCILVISGDVRQARMEEVRRLGADDLLPKPLNIEDLIAHLQRSKPEPLGLQRPHQLYQIPSR